jgi:tetratricopeptide (TPR) repeat protein
MHTEKMQKTLTQLVMSIRENKGKYILLLGAGVSASAGIPLATYDFKDSPSIVSRIKREVYRRFNNGKLLIDEEIDKWFKEQGWLQNPGTLYSDALDLIGITERERSDYLRKFFEGKKPTEGHRCIAEMIKGGLFSAVFTPNFDPLIEKAISDLDINPLVVAHNETVADVYILDERPKVIKLHGDYLFSNIKNMPDELTLEKNMQDKFELFLKECGLIVVGYAGNDNSIMDILEKAVKTKGYLPYGLRWGLKENSNPNERVQKLIESGKNRACLITFKDSDCFFKYLRENLLVEEIIRPSVALETAFDSYINKLLTNIEKEAWHARYTPLKMMSIILREFDIERDQSRKYEILEAVEKCKKLLILGEPGSGKTTSLKRLAEEHAKKEDLLPIFIELGNYAGSLMHLIEETIIGVDAETIEKKLTQGSCLILLDGLNEVGEEYGKVVKEIRHLISTREYQKNKFVVTCRTHNYNKDFGSEFMTMEIQPLDTYIIFKLLKDEFGKDNAINFYQQMDERMKGLCINPLMLTLMIYDLEKRKKPARNRAELFDQFIDTFLYDWEKRKAAKIAVFVKKKLLSALAFEMGVVTTIKFEDAQKIMAERLRRLIKQSEAPKDYDIIQITEELLINGLLKRSERRVSFFHQAVQEYFIALNISEENIPIDKYLKDRCWAETLVFLSGFIEDSTVLISKLIDIDPILAARCVEYAKVIDHDTVNKIIRLLVDRFKDRERTLIGLNRDLSYLIIKIIDRASKPLDYFFKEAYYVDGDAYAYSTLALFYLELDQYKDAIKAAEKAVNINPNDVFACFRLAIAYEQNNNLDQALKYYKKAYDLNPKDKYVCYDYAICFRDKNDLKNAIKYLEKAIELDPYYAYAHNVLGRCLKEQGFIEDAIKKHKKAIELDPGYAEPHSYLGDIYYSQNKFEGAKENYSKAVKIDPNNAKFHKNLAEVLEKLGTYYEANMHWENYLNINPWSNDAESVIKRIENNKIKLKS